MAAVLRALAPRTLRDDGLVLAAPSGQGWDGIGESSQVSSNSWWLFAGGSSLGEARSSRSLLSTCEPGAPGSAWPAEPPSAGGQPPCWVQLPTASPTEHPSGRVGPVLTAGGNSPWPHALQMGLEGGDSSVSPGFRWE